MPFAISTVNVYVRERPPFHGAPMTGWSIPLDSEIAPGCFTFHVPGNTLWFGTPGGEVRWLRLFDGRETLHGQGYDTLAALILSPNALGIDLLQQDGTLLRAVRDDADRAAAAVQATLDSPVIAAVPHPDEPLIVVLFATGGGGGGGGARRAPAQ